MVGSYRKGLAMKKVLILIAVGFALTAGLVTETIIVSHEVAAAQLLSVQG